jgi:hypothetical protein
MGSTHSQNTEAGLTRLAGSSDGAGGLSADGGGTVASMKFEAEAEQD